MTRLSRIAIAAAALCSVVFASQAHAQSYPNRPITVIVPFGAGSATDTICRIVVQQLGVALNTGIVVENKAGANGAIAGAFVARAAPDGYTLLMATNSPLSAAPSLNKTISYDPINDFVGLSRVGSYVFVLAVHPDVPAKTLPELIAYAKANPGKLTFASGNSSGVVAGETFKSWAGIDITHVPYRTAPPAINDLLAGRVSMMFTDITIAGPHLKSGGLRALATTRLQRSTLFPELPTLNEAGVKGFDMDSWAGLFAPAKTPPDIVKRLNVELRKIIDNPDTKTKIAVLGFEAFSSSTDELAEHVKVQLGKWTKMIKDAGIQAE
jgi:tripartite-type tricarboxylate transporter receptor subunit TctC